MKYHIINDEQVYDGFLKVHKAEVEHDSFYKKEAIRVTRESIEKDNSVGVLIYEKDSDSILFVKQFRYPARETDNGWMIEIPAGYLELDEDPAESAQRETEEETGYRASVFQHVYTFYLTPGICSEQMFLFYTEVSTADRISTGGGNMHEHEDIEVVKIPVNQLMDKMNAGVIVDAKTILALLWFITNHNKSII